MLNNGLLFLKQEIVHSLLLFLIRKVRFDLKKGNSPNVSCPLITGNITISEVIEFMFQAVAKNSIKVYAFEKEWK